MNEQQDMWKSGVVLIKDQTKAEVIEYYGKREIKIRFSGRHKRDFMTIVTHGQDDRLSEKSFVDLTIIVLEQLPLISNIIKQFQGNK